MDSCRVWYIYIEPKIVRYLQKCKPLLQAPLVNEKLGLYGPDA